MGVLFSDVVWLWKRYVLEHFSRVIAFGRSVLDVVWSWTTRFPSYFSHWHCVWSFGFSLRVELVVLLVLPWWRSTYIAASVPFFEVELTRRMANVLVCSTLVTVDVYRCVRAAL